MIMKGCDTNNMAKGTTGIIIQSVQRAINILDCFDRKTTELTHKEISARVGINISTTYGLVNTLLANNYLYQNSDGKIMLGLKLSDKARCAESTEGKIFLEIATPYVKALVNAVKMAGTLFIMVDSIPHYLLQELPDCSGYPYDHVSNDDPFYITATGKLALAHMPDIMLKKYLDQVSLTPLTVNSITSREKFICHAKEIIKQGYSYECEEFGEGVSAISVPIYSAGNLYGAISVTGAAQIISAKKSEIVQKLKGTAEQIMQHL